MKQHLEIALPRALKNNKHTEIVLPRVCENETNMKQHIDIALPRALRNNKRKISRPAWDRSPGGPRGALPPPLKIFGALELGGNWL